MRVLFTTQPAVSHLRAIVPLAQVVQRHGHEVAIAAPPFFGEEVISYGLRPFPVTVVPSGKTHLRSSREQFDPSSPKFEYRLLEMLAGERILAIARDILRRAEQWRPDLVVRDVAEFGGCLAAQVLHIPHVSVASVGAIGQACPFNRSVIAPMMASHRTELGLDPDPEMETIFRYLHVNLMPPAYDPVALQIPNSRCYRQTNPEPIGESLPQWITALPGDQPLVFASLGTRFHSIPGRLDFILDALSKLECSAVVAIGPSKDPTAFGKLPEHIRLIEAMAQPLFLQCCDLFITHAGFNSVRESLRVGVPMVLCPFTKDQPHNANRCAALRVGIAVQPAETNPDVLADACRELLRDGNFRRNARALQRQILALPSLDDLVKDLERLAKT